MTDAADFGTCVVLKGVGVLLLSVLQEGVEYPIWLESGPVALPETTQRVRGWHVCAPTLFRCEADGATIDDAVRSIIAAIKIAVDASRLP